MTITTIVLVLAGGSIMFFTSTIRPDPKPFPAMMVFESDGTTQEIKEYIVTDRKEGNVRLLATLLSVGAIIEIIVFLISYYASKSMVAPVKDAYDKQKLFIANASHELKTPLAVIQANMEALDVDKENEKWKDNIETEITHANKLVLNLLQLARMDSGSVGKTESEKFDLFAEIKNHIDIFKPKFSGKITFKSDARKEYSLPKQDVFQVLDILLDNATKYGNKKVTISLEQDNLTITNDGATIPKKDLAKVFDRFYQTDKTREGSGLGLAIASAICKQNNWQISCDSDNRTTTFKISFS